jgi:hypothetical protein
VDVDPSHIHASGPRRGLGAVWVRFDGDVSELPGFDAALAAHDPDEAHFQALESSYRVQPKDIEDMVRQMLMHGGPPVTWVAEASQDAVELHRLRLQRSADVIWENLVRALRRMRIKATPALLRAVSFRMEFDAALLAELDR